jgi:DNA-binding response OmpR family regulator
MQKKILIVDDDPDIVTAIGAVLEARGYEVISAGDGEEGLAKLRSDGPDLMILDLMMPKMDGYSVCMQLKDPRWAKYANIPILILSSIKEEASRRRYELETGVAMDVDDYVEKPIDPAILLERMEKILEKH